MALDPVPWIIGGGASHSPDVARAFAYVALGGKEGVIGIGSGKVSPGGGGNVEIAAGAFAIDNTYPGGEQQMYVGREVSTSLKAIPATAGTVRSDMIVVYIDDPQFGGTIPADPAVGPYIKYDVISNVGSTAVDVPGAYPHPALALARIDLPVSTSTVTSGMITDLRGAGTQSGVAGTPQYKKVTKSYAPVGSSSLSTAAPGVAWPYPTGWDVDVPAWATKMSARATLAGIRGDHHATIANYGKLWVVVGAGSPTGITGATTKYEVQEGPGGQDRHNLLAGFADVAVPAGLRGTSTNIKLYGQREGSAGGLNLIADTYSTIFLDVEFFEEPA